ncbi:MAG: DsbA family protein [Pseudomonadota bacterium]
MAKSKPDDSTIEYFYALASPWSYLGNEKLGQIANASGASIDAIIFNYDEMFEAAGTIPLPGRPPLRKAYRLVELARWSRWRQVPLNPEPRFYQGEVEEPDEYSAALLVTAAKRAGLDSLRLAHALSRALWAEERFPFVADEMRAITEHEGFDFDALTSKKAIESAKSAYQRATDYAIERRAFGMPFYIFREEPFWGQDRLEMLEAAVSAAMAPRGAVG